MSKIESVGHFILLENKGDITRLEPLYSELAIHLKYHF